MRIFDTSTYIKPNEVEGEIPKFKKVSKKRFGFPLKRGLTIEGYKNFNSKKIK